jgi:hypothetical protein
MQDHGLGKGPKDIFHTLGVVYLEQWSVRVADVASETVQGKELVSRVGRP